MQKSILTGVCWIVFCSFALAPHVDAQEKGTASGASRSQSCAVRGTIYDPSGAVIRNAQVTAAQPDGPAQTQTSSAEGRYCFPALPAGDYTLSISADGFATSEQRLTLAPPKPVVADVHLAIEVQQVQLDVSSDSVDQTDPNRNGDAIVLKGNAVDELPTDPSQLQQELQAMSGGDAPNIYVDGFSNGTIPPKNTIREIRINQNPYSARNDTDPGGGMIEILTKPGTGKMHGDLLVFGNDSSLNTKNPFVQTQPSYHSVQFNTDVNGPITKKASYFFNFMRRSNQSNAVVNAETLDTSNLNQVVFTEALPNPNTLDRFGSRFDLQLGTKSTIIAQYSYTDREQLNGGVGQLVLPSEAFNTSTITHQWQLSNSQVFGAKVVNDTRFQYTRTRTSETPASTAPTVTVQGAFSGGGSPAGAFTDNQDNFELQNYIAIQAGKHYLSPGVRLRVNRDSNSSRAGYNGQFTFASLAAYQATLNGLAQGLTPAQIASLGGGPSQFSITAGTPKVAIAVADVGLFYQDDWKVTPHFTLSYGLRYETQNYISEHHDFGPRLAFAWSLGAKKDKPAKFVIRGGSGIFYTRLASTNILNAERQNGILQQQYIVASPDFYPAIPPVSTVGPQNLPTIYQINPNFRSTYGIMSSIGIEHALGSRGLISAQYYSGRYNHVLVTRNANAPFPETYSLGDPTSGVRPLGTRQNIYEYDSSGVARTNRLTLNANFRAKNEFSVYGFYQFRHRSSDANGFASNSYDLAQDYGRGNQDVRQTLFLSINSPLLYRRIHLGAYVYANSGPPFNITVGQDLNGDSQFNDRPAFATDLSRPSVVRTAYGVFDTNPIAGQTLIPINYGQSPAVISVSAEAYREFTFGPVEPVDSKAKPSSAPQKPNAYIRRRYNMTLAVEAENAINRVNLASPIGVLGSPLFGKSNGLSGDAGNPNANRVINLVLSTRF